MKFPIKLSLVIFILSGLALTTANVSLAESWTERVTNGLNQAREALEAADKAADAQAKKILEKGKETLKQATEALEAADKAADAQARKSLENLKRDLKKIKKALEIADARVDKAIMETPEAIDSFGNEASRKVKEVLKEAKEAFEAADKAADAQAMKAYEELKPTGEKLYEIALDYAKSKVLGKVGDVIMVKDAAVEITEKMRKGDIKGAKKAAEMAVMDALVGDELAAYELVMTLPGAKNTQEAVRLYAERVNAKLSEPVIVIDEEILLRAAMAYYEEARAYAEEVYGVTLSPASKVFKTSEETAKDAEEERRKQMRLRGPRRRHKRAVHHPCH